MGSGSKTIGVRFQLFQLFTPCRLGRRSPRQSRDVRVGPTAMSLSIRSISPIVFLRFEKNLLTTKHHLSHKHHRGRQRGRFFRAKAQKKIAPDGRPKRVFIIAGMPTTSYSRPKRVFNSSEVLTPCRFGRRSLPLRANVRVGPPAMSSSVRSFFFDRVSAVQ